MEAIMSDAKIRQDILDELEFEPSIDANDIGVAVENGVVTLTGYVPTYPQKLAVEHAGARIKGVKAIAEEIQVRYHQGAGSADDEIAQRIVDMLKWSTLVPEGKVQIKVQHGWVTLTGVLDWNYQRRGAEDVVRNVRGVAGIKNLIELRSRVVASDVRKQIESALRRTAELEGRGIDVKVTGNEVVLEGTVKSWHDRKIAEQAAWATGGVTSVIDRLAVG